jgi:hypothetical protein
MADEFAGEVACGAAQVAGERGAVGTGFLAITITTPSEKNQSRCVPGDRTGSTVTRSRDQASDLLNHLRRAGLQP